MNAELFWAGFAAFAFAVGTGFGWVCFGKQHAKMKKYITTEGTLLSANMKIYWKSGREWYEPIVEYAYTVGGREYRTASILFGEIYVSAYRKDSEKILARILAHPSGGLPVFYNPDKPSESFLDKKASSIDLQFAVVLAIFTILFGALGIWMMIKGIMGVTGNAS